MRFISIILFYFIGLQLTFGQGYEIKVQVSNLVDSTVQLAYYYGNNQYIATSSELDKKGKAVFKGKEALPQGLYILILPNKHFDLIINENQKFSLELDANNPIETVKFKNSAENSKFIEYQLNVGRKIRQQMIWQKIIDNKSVSEDSITIIQEKIVFNTEELNSYWREVADENEKTYLNSLLYAMNGESGKNFDNINFSDGRLLYSPVLYRSLQSLLARNVNNIKPAELIIKDLDNYLEKAKQSDEIYKYSLNFLLDFFHGYQKFGLNRVFHHIAYNHILTESVDWFNEKNKALIKKTADEWMLADVGNLAPNLKMITVDSDTLELYSLEERYTLLLFWKTGCGHCTDALKALKTFYDQTDNLDISIFSVYTKTNANEWEDFLNENNVRNLWYNVYDPKDENGYHSKYYVIGTPLLYVLDKEKKVVSIWNGQDEINTMIQKLESQRSQLQKK